MYCVWQVVKTLTVISNNPVESQRVHIQSICKVCNKNLECCSIKLKNTHILLSQVYCVWQVVKTLTIISNNSVCHTKFVEKSKQRFIFNNIFLNLTVYKIIWKKLIVLFYILFVLFNYIVLYIVCFS